jgi:hypothetical protein
MSHFLDAVEGNGNSALWLAAAAGHRDAVAALLQVTTASTSVTLLIHHAHQEHATAGIPAALEVNDNSAAAAAALLSLPSALLCLRSTLLCLRSEFRSPVQMDTRLASRCSKSKRLGCDKRFSRALLRTPPLHSSLLLPLLPRSLLHSSLQFELLAI